MILVLDPSSQRARLEDADNFRQLHAQVTGAAYRLSELGDIAAPGPDAGHLWVSVSGLRALGRADADWQRQFDAMIEYARGKGWLDAAGERVRVHIEG